ncbi:hypothetical protein FACS189499_05560 [Clostridia bacterium]|nr:hypothetical protein FACS189499_05560 [Clostridia bacterium]
MTMDRLTEQEKLMYDVMGAIANSNIPIVYKGAMITKLILQEHQFDDFVRETRDIDASWADSYPPSTAKLTEMLNNALCIRGLKAVVTREHDEKKSACYDVLDALSGELCMTIDIDMRASVDSRTYQYGNTTFRGVTLDNVIADKISAVSSDKIFRRAKDLIDLYALSHCVTVKIADIRAIWERENRVIGSFDAFRNCQSDLRHSYEKLRRVDTKPDFDEIYGYLNRFLTPFIQAKTDALIWDNRENDWSDVS